MRLVITEYAMLPLRELRADLIRIHAGIKPAGYDSRIATESISLHDETRREAWEPSKEPIGPGR